MSPSRRRAGIVAMLVALAAACGGGTAPTPNPANLAGTWTGTLGSGSGGGRALRISWAVAAMIGAQAIGPATVSTSPATASINFLGSLTGTVSGDRVTLTLNAQTDPSRCNVRGTGIGTVAGTAITGTLDVTFSGCEGLDLQPPASNQLTLTKQ